MLNFRKLRQDFASSVLKEGKDLYEQQKIISAKILRLETDSIRFSANVKGNYENSYECEIEIDRFESQMIHSDCDCSYRYDCHHLAALIFYLEDKIDAILVEYSKQADIHSDEALDQEEKQELLETIKAAADSEVVKADERCQKQELQEYVNSAAILSTSPFFFPEEKKEQVEAELAVIFNPQSLVKNNKNIEIQLVLRLPFRSKPLQIPSIQKFVEAIRYEEPVFVGGKKYCLSLDSFDSIGKIVLKTVMDHARYADSSKGDRAQRVALIDRETFGFLLSEVHDAFSHEKTPSGFVKFSDELPAMPCLYFGGLETPLRFSPSHSILRFSIEYIQPPSPKLLLNPLLVVDQEGIVLEDACLFECAKPGMIYQEVYYRFPAHIKRMHLVNLLKIREMTIPEALFGSFVENSLGQLKRFAEMANQEVIDKFATLPFTGDLKPRCELSYLDGELEAELFFFYDGQKIPAALEKLEYGHIESFISKEGILARNIVQESKIVEDLFQDFVYDEKLGHFFAKSEKKIIEFMTEVIPRNQDKIEFICPQNLLDQFIYDDTQYKLKLDYSETIGYYQIDLETKGPLLGIDVELLWDCIGSKRSFIELERAPQIVSKKEKGSKLGKILVLDLEKITKLVQLFDELGIKKLTNHKEERPLWNLVSIDNSLFKDLPVKFSMSNKLRDIRKQMLGEKAVEASPIPMEINAKLRGYQNEGVHWLERLRCMYLNGILADDMGLGKTLQAITAITQDVKKNPKSRSLIICPTSLLYNWKEELNKFNPKLKAVVIDGIPSQRKKMLDSIDGYHVLITSYTLLQKDIEIYLDTFFTYAILDEAQHIKNRGTRNAKSVKMIRAAHRLILTGTPIENSLDELWSLFDFLMPGFLSTYERFIEKFVRITGDKHLKNMQYLKQKVSPFILRRMKSDVLHDLPAVSEIVYHCQLSKVQKELYISYAKSARDELVKLVERDGFEKVHIHVLATLTRLKQICCHPAIFAKEKAEPEDSSKYEMLLELLQTLVEGGHKTVIFSQYTKMLKIMREDFEHKGIKFSYLDGSSKNRMQIVDQFNNDPEIPVFLVSLKAGGTGLNLVGADTVIHYDLWWNPAVENQATDRVHRMGQKKSVSAYKLITLNTIEEKIVQMQKRKKGLVKKVVSCDDEAMAKLTWEDVLELLQT